LEEVFACHKFINNLVIEGSALLAKINQKTMAYLNDMRDLKRAEYLDYLQENKINPNQTED